MSNAPGTPVPSTGQSAQRPMATADRTVYLVGHAHLDAVWLWPWEEGYDEVRATFRSALDRMDEDPDSPSRATRSVPAAWVEEPDPALFAGSALAWRKGGGSMPAAGGSSRTATCPAGSSFVRQGLYGQGYLQSRFARMATVGMNVDPVRPPRDAAAGPARAGNGSYIFLRPGPHDGELSPATFRWRRTGRNRAPAYRIPHEYASGGVAVSTGSWRRRSPPAGTPAR